MEVSGVRAGAVSIAVDDQVVADCCVRSASLGVFSRDTHLSGKRGVGRNAAIGRHNRLLIRGLLPLVNWWIKGRLPLQTYKSSSTPNSNDRMYGDNTRHSRSDRSI